MFSLFFSVFFMVGRKGKNISERGIQRKMKNIPIERTLWKVPLDRLPNDLKGNLLAVLNRGVFIKELLKFKIDKWIIGSAG